MKYHQLCLFFIIVFCSFLVVLAFWKLKTGGAFDYFIFLVEDTSQKTRLFSVIPGLHSVFHLKS